MAWTGAHCVFAVETFCKTCEFVIVRELFLLYKNDAHFYFSG